MTSSGAWYHLSTMEAALEKFRAAIRENAAEATRRFEEDRPTGWKWDSWFSLPVKRELTYEEYYRKNWGDNQYSWMGKYKERYYTSSAMGHIALAYQSEGNIVYLSGRAAREDFGGFLTQPVDTSNNVYLIEG